MSVTSTPRDATPSANARLKLGELGRMSCPMTTPAAPSGRHDDLGEGRADRPRDLLVELLGDEAAHVVGLDDVGESVESRCGRARRQGGGHGPRRLSECGQHAQCDRVARARRRQESRRTRRCPRRPTSTRTGGRCSAAAGRGAGRGRRRGAARPRARRRPARAGRPWSAAASQYSPPSRTTSQPARSGEPFGVPGAEVVGVRLGVGRRGDRARRWVAVDVGQRRDGRAGTPGLRALPRHPHVRTLRRRPVTDGGGAPSRRWPGGVLTSMVTWCGATSRGPGGEAPEPAPRPARSRSARSAGLAARCPP